MQREVNLLKAELKSAKERIKILRFEVLEIVVLVPFLEISNN